MCGLWALLYNKITNIIDGHNQYMNIINRGPDRSYFLSNNNNFSLGFHRLSILDTSINGDQPFLLTMNEHTTAYVMCNGEIYNYKELIEKYNICESELQSKSDCEILPILFKKIGLHKMVEEIIGEYALAIITNDTKNKKIEMYMARDECGVRPLFYGYDENSFGLSSELKGLSYKNSKQFPPRHIGYISYDQNNKIFSKLEIFEYFEIKQNKLLLDNYEQIKKLINSTLIDSVRCRMMGDQPIGCLLSGGLDSSLIASIASMILKEKDINAKLKTFSIGMDGSTDEPYARAVAKYIGSEHTHIHIDSKEWLEALDEVIYATETFDITTIRASTGQYLAAKKIKETTDIKVLLNGDGSDELFMGYLYNWNEKDIDILFEDLLRLIKNIHYFDGLRVDRGISSNGLESRVPFLDKRLIKILMSIEPKYISPHNLFGSSNKIEKSLLRESFKDGYLPYEILYRKKEAFSDGVSSKEKSWFTIIQKYMDTKYTDSEFITLVKSYTHCIPPTKEALYYRQTFEKLFPGIGCENIIPYYWLPKWSGGVNEPSARILPVYNK